MQVQKGLIGLIVILQTVLFLAHFLVYETWTFSPAGSDIPGALWIKLILILLSVSFVAASLLAFRYTNAAVRAFYRVAAVWLGFLTFFFFGALCSWIIFGVARLAGLEVSIHRIVEWLFGAAVVGGPLRSFQRKLDANHSNNGTARELAAGLARAQRGANQRPAPGAYAKRQFSAADGCEDFAGKARRDFHCWRFV